MTIEPQTPGGSSDEQKKDNGVLDAGDLVEVGANVAMALKNTSVEIAAEPVAPVPLVKAVAELAATDAVDAVDAATGVIDIVAGLIDGL